MFLEQGAKVSAHYNRIYETLGPLVSKYGQNIRTCSADLATEGDVTRMFDDISKDPEFGPVQVLIVNHGIWPTNDAPVFKMSLAQWNNTLNVNLTASFLVIREYLRRLGQSDVTDDVRRKAAVVLVGSTAGKYGEAGHADYAASKSGELQANRVMRTRLNIQ